MKQLFFLFIICSAAGCAGEDETIPAEPISPASINAPVEGPINLAGCYRMIIAQDTAYLELKQKGDSAYGMLEYRRFEKDSNKGMVSLKLTKDLADGEYVFNSEGRSSVRQIIFKVEAGGLAEGYGDIEMKGDTAYFKYPHSLHYEEKHLFVKSACK